jgi:hypothetical protein
MGKRLEQILQEQTENGGAEEEKLLAGIGRRDAARTRRRGRPRYNRMRVEQ